MDTLTLTLNDLGNHGLGQSANSTVVIAIEVGGINDSPTVVAPTTYYEVNEDETLQINGVAIFDVDASSGLYTARMYSRDGMISGDFNPAKVVVSNQTIAVEDTSVSPL